MTETGTLFAGRYLGLRERAGWEFATRTNASAVAVLIAVTDRNELLLVEQYRIPVQSPVIELPAGLVGDLDDPNEAVLVAAQRELREETGYQAAQLTNLLSCPSSAGMTDEIITFVRASGLQRISEGGGDSSEEITVHRVPLDEADAWMAEQVQAGMPVDPKIYTALYWLQRECEQPA